MKCPVCVPSYNCRCGFVERRRPQEDPQARAARERAELEASVAHLRPEGKPLLIQTSIRQGLERRPRGTRSAAIRAALAGGEWLTAREVHARLDADFILEDVSRRLLEFATRGVIEQRKVKHPRSPLGWAYQYRAAKSDG